MAPTEGPNEAAFTPKSLWEAQGTPAMHRRLLLQCLQRKKEGGRTSPAASKGPAEAAVEEHVEELLRVHLALRGEGPPAALVPARQPRRLRAVPVVRRALVRIAQA